MPLPVAGHSLLRKQGHDRIHERDSYLRNRGQHALEELIAEIIVFKLKPRITALTQTSAKCTQARFRGKEGESSLQRDAG